MVHSGVIYKFLADVAGPGVANPFTPPSRRACEKLKCEPEIHRTKEHQQAQLENARMENAEPHSSRKLALFTLHFDCPTYYFLVLLVAHFYDNCFCFIF